MTIGWLSRKVTHPHVNRVAGLNPEKILNVLSGQQNLAQTS